jgi:hypothetical protein
MALFLENPDDRTQPLFDRLVEVAAGNVGNVPVQINYVPHGVYWVVARLETTGARWQHAGNPDHIVEAFQIWLKSVTERTLGDDGHDPGWSVISV